MTSKAIGMVRRDVAGRGADLHALAEQHGCPLIFTVILDTGPLISALVIAQNIYEHDASAVVVPSFAHVDRDRHIVTGLAALITPVQVYPRGHQWPLVDTTEH